MTRRWNGWGDDSTTKKVSKHGAALIKNVIGETQPLAEASLKQVLKAVPKTRLPKAVQKQACVSVDKEVRVRHARGQSFPDWVAFKSGEFGYFPDGVAFPTSTQEVQELLTLAKQYDLVVIPYGGGTSVAGHINPQASKQPVLTIAMSQMNKLINIDTDSQIATFGAGAVGPEVEAQLEDYGYTLGHYPQSWELSTLGGWVAARSSGQQSLRYGRIEAMFAGGTLVTPQGIIEIPDIPASSAGPDLREMMMGTEGRVGIFTEVKIRITRLPEQERFMVFFLPDWQVGKTVVQEAVQQKIPLSMLRLSNANETNAHLHLGTSKTQFALINNYLKLRGLDNNKCMLTFGVTGSVAQNTASLKQFKAIIKANGGVGGKLANLMGSIWAHGRFKFPYLRGTLWQQGIMVDTCETATNWANVDTLLTAMETAVANSLTDEQEQVMVFTHLSHMYGQGASIYSTYFFRAAHDYPSTLAYWQKIKAAVSGVIANGKATISHQHGVGRDHAPYLMAEKGELGMQVINQMIKNLDPNGRMNPGVLIDEKNITQK